MGMAPPSVSRWAAGGGVVRGSVGWGRALCESERTRSHSAWELCVPGQTCAAGPQSPHLHRGWAQHRGGARGGFSANVSSTPNSHTLHRGRQPGTLGVRKGAVLKGRGPSGPTNLSDLLPLSLSETSLSALGGTNAVAWLSRSGAVLRVYVYDLSRPHHTMRQYPGDPILQTSKLRDREGS